MELRELRELVVDKWPFDKTRYPRIGKLNEPEQVLFAVDHILKHFQKELGALAEFSQQLDHSKYPGRYLTPNFARENITPIVRKLLVNTVRLASVVGITDGDIERDFEAWKRSITLQVTEEE